MSQELQSKIDLFNQFPDKDSSEAISEYNARILHHLRKERDQGMLLLGKTINYIIELEKTHPLPKKRSK